jgi:hypothetical protein
MGDPFGKVQLSANEVFAMLKRARLAQNPRFNADIDSIEEMRLSGCSLDLDSLKVIASLPQLSELTLHKVQMPPGGFQELKGRPISKLTLSEMNLTKEDFAVIGSLPIQYLTIVNTKIEGSWLAGPNQFQSLGVLTLTKCGLTQKKLAEIQSLPRLRWIELTGQEIDGLPDFAKSQLPALTNIGLTGTKVRDFSPLLAIPQLTHVYLHNMDIDTVGLETLAKLNKLQYLVLGHLKFEGNPLLDKTAKPPFEDKKNLKLEIWK